MISWKEVVSNFPNDFAWQGRDTSRPLQIADIQYDIAIIGGREVSRPYRFGFSPKASGFYPFGDATDLVRGRREGCGVADSSPSLKSDMPQH